MASEEDINCTCLKYSKVESNKQNVEKSQPIGTPWTVNGHLSNLRSDSIASEETALELRVYKRRFWILGVFAFIVSLNYIIWGTYGPIIHSVEYAYGWSDGYVALLESWGCINSVLFMVPISLFNRKYGVRKAVLFGISIMTLGTASRCVTTNDVAFTYLASFAAIADGIASCTTQSLPTMISTTWFPANERTTATATSMILVQLSGMLMYLSPLLVREPLVNQTITGTQNFTLSKTEVPPTLSRDEVKGDIRTLMFIHFGMAFIALLCALIYFPDKPSKPPSKSAAEVRTNFKKSFQLIIRNLDFILLLLSSIVMWVFPVIWFSVMNFSLQCIEINQDQAMYIAISTCLVSAVASLVVARLMDHLQGHMKLAVISLNVIAAVFFIWFLLITEKVIVISSNVSVYLAVTGGISASAASIPIFMELMVEMAYPCPESFVGAVMIFCMDFSANIFLLLMMIPTECFRWLSYVLAIGVSGTILPLVLTKVDRKRSAIDGEYLASSL